MPNADELPDAVELGKRLEAGMNAHDNAGTGVQERFATLMKVSAPTVSQWFVGRYRPTPAKVRRLADLWKCNEQWLYWGKGEAPSWWLHGDVVTRTYTPERRSDDDVTALKIAVQSLLHTLARKIPGSATAFLQDQKDFAGELEFPIEAGLMLDLEGIAKSAQADEAARARSRRRRGSGGGKKL